MSSSRVADSSFAIAPTTPGARVRNSRCGSESTESSRWASAEQDESHRRKRGGFRSSGLGLFAWQTCGAAMLHGTLVLRATVSPPLPIAAGLEPGMECPPNSTIRGLSMVALGSELVAIVQIEELPTESAACRSAKLGVMWAIEQTPWLRNRFVGPPAVVRRNLSWIPTERLSGPHFQARQLRLQGASELSEPESRGSIDSPADLAHS